MGEGALDARDGLVEVALSGGAEACAGGADHLGLAQQAVEEIPGGLCIRGAQSQRGQRRGQRLS